MLHLLALLLLLKLMLLLLLQLCDLPLKIAHRVNGGSIASRPAFAERSRPVCKRQQLLFFLLHLLLQLLQLPLNASHHLDDRVFTSRAAFVGFSMRVYVCKRHQHVPGVIGQRALHKHDALESGLDAGGLQPLHALPHKDARFVDGEKEG